MKAKYENSIGVVYMLAEEHNSAISHYKNSIRLDSNPNNSAFKNLLKAYQKKYI